MRTSVTLCVAATFLILSCACGSAQFEEHLKQHRLQYSGAEYKYRQEVFEGNMRVISAHNSQPGVNFTMGVNSRTDWTHAEFMRLHGRLPTGAEGLASLKAGGSRGPIRIISYVPGIRKLPAAVDPRRANPPQLTPIKDQGRCGGCWAFAAASCIETRFTRKYRKLVVLSTQQIISCDRQSYCCDGGWGHKGWQYLADTQGLYSEQQYPYIDYNNRQGSCTLCRTRSVRGTPVAHVVDIQKVDPCKPLQLMAALSEVGPVSVAVTADAWQHYRGGVLDVPLSVAGKLNHEVQAVGYGYDRRRRGMKYWIIRNSYGPSWGESGFIRLLREDKPQSYRSRGTTVCGTTGVLSEVYFPDVVKA